MCPLNVFFNFVMFVTFASYQCQIFNASEMHFVSFFSMSRGLAFGANFRSSASY